MSVSGTGTVLSYGCMVSSLKCIKEGRILNAVWNGVIYCTSKTSNSVWCHIYMIRDDRCHGWEWHKHTSPSVLSIDLWSVNNICSTHSYCYWFWSLEEVQLEGSDSLRKLCSWCQLIPTNLIWTCIPDWVSPCTVSFTCHACPCMEALMKYMVRQSYCIQQSQLSLIMALKLAKPPEYNCMQLLSTIHSEPH